MIDKFKADRERDRDWERSPLKFLVFYILIGICGAFNLIFGILTLVTDYRFWGHSLTELILGAILLVMALIGFMGVTAGFRGKLYD